MALTPGRTEAWLLTVSGVALLCSILDEALEISSPHKDPAV